MMIPVAALAAAIAFAPDQALAQSASRSGQQPVDQPSPWRPLRIAKWTTLLGSAGAAAYGFVTNGRADDHYRDLELACTADATMCRDRLPNGAFRDADLEASYQEVLDLDRRSRRALLAGQIGIAASVALFLLDLGNERPPADIPYVPRELEVAPRRDGSLMIRVKLDE
jgi:hypothetical protein